MTLRETMAGMTRAERRDAERTHKVAQAALQTARGSRPHARARLRHQAGESIDAARIALDDGAGAERVQQLLDRASRRLRAAEDLR